MSNRPRARDIGIEIGVFSPGKLNGITDVNRVKVGHKTVCQEENIRSGVTCILPHGGNIFQDKVIGATHVTNGFGKSYGFIQLEELGTIETPICLTDTLNVPTVVNALIDYILDLPDNENIYSVNPLVGETNMGYLNVSRKRPVQRKHVFEAIESATADGVEEGSIGAGMGTRCLGWKGGIGTSSRVLPAKKGGFRVGVLVQTNFGGSLVIDGVPVGKELGKNLFDDFSSNEVGSIMMIVATDAPLTYRNLKRLAKRAPYGMVRTGGISMNGSGDLVIAFSTDHFKEADSEEIIEEAMSVNNTAMNPLFKAVQEATEEAIYNSILKANTVTGRDDHTVEAIPIKEVKSILRKYNS